jgi:hypothetical protein
VHANRFAAVRQAPLAFRAAKFAPEEVMGVLAANQAI